MSEVYEYILKAYLYTPHTQVENIYISIQFKCRFILILIEIHVTFTLHINNVYVALLTPSTILASDQEMTTMIGQDMIYNMLHNTIYSIVQCTLYNTIQYKILIQYEKYNT